MKTPSSSDRPENSSTSTHLIRFGWWALLVYLSLGLTVEALHGFKAAWYLDVGNDTRRLMFTLGHAHGTALALVNIVAGLTARGLGLALTPSAAGSLRWAAILLPAGFFLGGLVIHGGDPGLGILLVPVGAVLLFYGVARIAR